MRSKIFSTLSVLVVILASIYVLVLASGKIVQTVELPSPVGPVGAYIDIKAPEGVIRAAIASTSAEQELGLGDRSSLPADSGMIFPFQSPGDYGFWMKDMRFPLDIVWILPDKRVAGVAANISPDTYPEVFFPPLAVSYVLEINSGSAARFGIATGTQLVF